MRVSTYSGFGSVGSMTVLRPFEGFDSKWLGDQNKAPPLLARSLISFVPSDVTNPNLIVIPFFEALKEGNSGHSWHVPVG